MSKSLETIQNDPKTSRTGTKWTEDEESQIQDCIQKGMEYDQIALKFQRTINSVKSRMMEIYIEKVLDQDLILEEVSTLLHIPMDLLTVAKRRYESKMVPKKKRNTSLPVDAKTAPPQQQAPQQQAPKQQAPKQQAPKQQAPKQQTPKQQTPKQQASKQQDLKYMPILVEIRDYLKILVDK